MGLVALRSTGGAKTNAANTWGSKQTFSSDIEVDGALDHDGTTVGLFGVTPVTRRAAFTQSHSSATRTHPAMSAATVASTAATNVGPFGYTTAAQADAIRAAVNNLISDVETLKQVVNALIDDSQAIGIAQ